MSWTRVVPISVEEQNLGSVVTLWDKMDLFTPVSALYCERVLGREEVRQVKNIRFTEPAILSVFYPPTGGHSICLKGKQCY